MGLHEAAEAICCGIVLDLHKAKGAGSDGPLGWAPDFPAEEACHAVMQLLGACPPNGRVAARDHLIEALRELAPDWDEMIARAVLWESGSLNGEACVEGPLQPRPGCHRLAHCLMWLVHSYASRCRRTFDGTNH